MTAPPASIRKLRSALANGVTSPTRLAETALANANRNPSRNTYLWHDPAWTMREAERAEQMPRGEDGPFGDGRDILWGLPISVKDCFDLAGAPTTCGTKFYRDRNGIAPRDSWIVERLRARGAVITGKTHLHPLAYGITGENPEFGDCLQPGKDGALTGGSSSGACASVMEGSAVAAIGTDTGGSVRAPAALCGLAGYRASLGRGNWRGGAHLSQSFDTLGWLFADVEEAPLLAAFTQTTSQRTCMRTAASLSSAITSCTTANRKSSINTALPSAISKTSASAPRRSTSTGGAARRRSSRPSRHGKPPACIAATSNISKP
jgi:Asp-tRNA(Asn)/Glu-tRNA(Gln) amidotransferase A subunit family amidase